MPAQINTNITPYHDDFDERKDYYRVMYKPGFPIQARELTTTQSILQNQIEQLASSFMKVGDNVVPGQFLYSNPVAYVRLSSQTQGSLASDFIGYTITGVQSGVKAHVDFATEKTDTDDPTLFITYKDAGTNAKFTTFIEGEQLESDTPDLFTATVGVNEVSKPIETPPMGFGCTFVVEEGYYFVDGFMVRNDAQTIAVGKYDTRPTCDVGFVVVEDFVTSNEDESLKDNATGHTNFAAPGADRLQIKLVLSIKDKNTVEPNFIRLITLEQGNVIGKDTPSVKFDWLYDILAQRTFDESGNYIVTDFPIKPMEYWNYFSSRDESVEFNPEGVFNPQIDPATDTVIFPNEYPPVPGTGSTDNITFSEADAKYAIRVSPGKAYIEGYEASFTEPFYVYGDKARTQNFIERTSTQVNLGYAVDVSRTHSAPDIENINAGVNAVAFDTLTCYRNFNDGYVGKSVDGDGVPLNYGEEPKTTYHVILDNDVTFNENQIGTLIYPNPVDGPITTNSCVVTTEVSRGDSLYGATVLHVNVVPARPSGSINPKSFSPRQLLNPTNQDGVYDGFNSIFSLGVLTSAFYTELFVIFDVIGVENLDLLESNKDWKPGRQIVGTKSNAVGEVQSGSGGNYLVIASVVGQFVNGETIVQMDYDTGETKTGRLLRTGEVVDFAFTDGNPVGIEEIDVTSLGSTITLKVDGTDVDTNLKLTKLGRDKILKYPYFNPDQRLELPRVHYSVVGKKDGSPVCSGYAINPRAVITNTITKTKSFHCNGNGNFSSDISFESQLNTDIKTLADGATFNGKKGYNYVTCNNFTGNPGKELVNGDLVTFSDDDGNLFEKIVQFATEPSGYGQSREKSYIFFTTTLESDVTSTQVQVMRVKSTGKLSNNGLLVQLPATVIASLESDPNNTGINYEVQREFIVEGAAGEQEIIIDQPNLAQNEFFDSDVTKTSLVIAKSKSNETFPGQVGRSLALTQDLNPIELTDSDKRIMFRLNNPLEFNCQIKVITSVKVENAKARRKEIIRDFEIVVEYNEDEKDPEKTPATQQVISLERADIFKLNSVMMETDNGNMLDIKDNYYFENGQYDTFYGLGYLLLKEGMPRPTGRLKINFDYFEHDSASGNGFFSVDSYTHDRGISYGEIPVYRPRSIKCEKNSKSNIYINLRDCIDFRPIVNTGPIDPSVISLLFSEKEVATAKNFKDTRNGGNAFSANIPVANTLIQCDIQHYMPKVDTLFLDRYGNMVLKQGIPGEIPAPPGDIPDGIRLYDLYLPAYTFSPKDIKVEKFNHRRYTMKDIFELDQRVTKVEDLVQLSILEQSAINVALKDAISGLERFKNAIITDRFADHAKGSVGINQYRNSVDPRLTHLRPPIKKDQSILEERNQTQDQRESFGFYRRRINDSAVYSNIVTVPYDNIDFVGNPDATRFINIQPYSVFTWEGKLTLEPAIDTFTIVNNLDALRVQDNSVFDAITNLSQELQDSGIGTVWGDWETDSTSTSRTRETRRNTAQERNNLANQGVTISGNATGSRNINVTTTTETVVQSRDITTRNFDVTEGDPIETSYGTRVTDVSVASQMRSIDVRIVAEKLKPNTRYYPFFDGIPVGDWVSPGVIENEVYVPWTISKQKGFGEPLITDRNGYLNGMFVVPDGTAPVFQSFFTTIDDVEYRTSGPTLRFNAGQRTFTLIENAEGASNISQVIQPIQGMAEAEFTASGIIADKQELIISTRQPNVTITTRVQEQTRRSEEVTTNANFVPPRPAPRDPVAQTFEIPSDNPAGVFVTELDVFFRTRDQDVPVEVYLTTTSGQTPTETILPHSQVTKNPFSVLRVVVDLNDQSSDSLIKGSTIRGLTSGATGIVRGDLNGNDLIFNSEQQDTNTNVTNTVYDLYLSNYDGEFVPGETLQLVPSSGDGVTILPLESTITIAQDELIVDRIDLVDLGSGYSPNETSTDNTTITIDAPELPGGINATVEPQEIKVSEISSGADTLSVIDRGTGYSDTTSPDGDDTIALDTTIGSGLKVSFETQDGSVLDNVQIVNPGSGYKNGDIVAISKGNDTANRAKLQISTLQSANGQVYKIKLSNPGSGYTKVPSVVFNDKTDNQSLSEARALVRTRPGRRAVVMGVATSTDATVPTTFKFDSPVYLMGNKFYAFVVKSNSLEYTIWTSKLGENKLGTDQRVVSQKSLGSLFMSQNGGLWTADQTQDVTFQMRRANFLLNTTSSLTMENKPVDVRDMPLNPIETSSGGESVSIDTNSDRFEENPKIVKIYHPNHGLSPGDYTRLEGVEAPGGFIGGISVDDLNTLHEVVEVEIDTYTIKSRTPALSKVKSGGDKVRGSYNIPYETINLYSGLIDYEDTRIVATNRAVGHAGVSLYNRSNQYKRDVPNDIPIMDTCYYNDVKQVANYLNEAKYNQSELLDKSRSLQTTMVFSTENADISPVIDIDRTNMNLVHNLVENFNPDEYVMQGLQNSNMILDDVSGFNIGDKFTFTTKDGRTRSVTIKDILQDQKTIVVAGSRLRDLRNIDRVVSRDVNVVSTSTTAPINFVPEEDSLGSSYAKWISSIFTLENQSDGIDVYLSAVLYNHTDILCYYKPKYVGFDGEISDLNWIPFNETQPKPGETELDENDNLVPTPGLPDNVLDIKPRSAPNVDPRSIRPEEWQELVFSAQNVAEFDGIQIKIVMKSENPAKCPVIDDLRVICSE